MPREIILANPTLFIALDRSGWMRDIYYPHVGELNHTQGYPCRLGLSIDRRFRWLDESCHPSPGWKAPASNTAYVKWELASDAITVEMLAAVDPERPLFVRRFVLTNKSATDIAFGLFMHHDFRIAESDIGDTALFHPSLRIMLHHKRDFWFGIGTFRHTPPIVQYACGMKGFGGAEGTWRDAEDGMLSLNAIAQGSVDSTVMLHTEAKAGDQTAMSVWLACARTLDEIEVLASELQDSDPEELIEADERNFSERLEMCTSIRDTKPSYHTAFARAIHITQSHASDTGAILAANDTDILQTARAHYSYVWPRDGAIISHALARAGYPEYGQRLLGFLRPLITPKRPYFLQKYGPTGTIGASWHPWVEHGREIVPFQEDGTALILWLAGSTKHILAGMDERKLFRNFISPAANFVTEYVDEITGLPLPSYDPWEERRGIHAWTCGAIIGGVKAAAGIASSLGFTTDAKRWRRAASNLLIAVDKHLWDDGLGRYVRSVYPGDDGNLHRDPTPDASIAGLFLFGAMRPDEPRLEKTMDIIFRDLEIKTQVGGIARYLGDYYFQTTDDLESVPGNPWIICTLWAARWNAARGRQDKAAGWIDWAISHSSQAGLLAEQLHPFTGEPLAVQPLAWSHAELMLAIMDSNLATDTSAHIR